MRYRNLLNLFLSIVFFCLIDNTDAALATCDFTSDPTVIAADCFGGTVSSTKSVGITINSGKTHNLNGFLNWFTMTGQSINAYTNNGILDGGTGTQVFKANAGSVIGTFTNNGTVTLEGTQAFFITGSRITNFVNNGTWNSNGTQSFYNAGGGIISNWTNTNIFNSNGTLSFFNNGSSNIGTMTNSGAWDIGESGFYNSGTIGSITNTGSITGLMNNSGGISTLNNAQGAASSALRYASNLPANYNIIINSPTDYGKLTVTGPSGNMTFGIYNTSTVAAGTYASVLTGVPTGQLPTKSGTFGAFNWLLSATGVSNTWDLAFSLAGPSATDTQSSMQYQASQLRSAFNTQTVAANFALNYDCNVFDVKGMCISAGGRYTTIDNPGINNSAAVVTLGYKVNPNIRIGAYLDQNINISKPTGIDIGNNTPLMGAYAVWNKEQSGLGYQVRLANTYQDKDVTQTRTIFDTSEAGSGKSSLQSQSYLAELSYAFQYEDKTLVRPYFGLRYTHLKQDGYTEATVFGSVDNPLTVAALRDKGTTALLGVKVNHSLTDKATLTAQLGLEQDLHHKVDNYSATDLNASDLTAIAFNSNIKRTRPVASIGAFYDVTKTQRASATINYQQLPFQSTGSATAYVNYMIGF